MVAVNCATAAALVAEGAICLDADLGLATRDGRSIAIPSVDTHCGAPILVCGSAAAVQAVAQAWTTRAFRPGVSSTLAAPTVAATRRD